MKNNLLLSDMLRVMSCEGTQDDKEEKSSSLWLSTLSFYESEASQDTSDIPNDDTSTAIDNTNSFSTIERLIIKRTALDDEEEKDKLVNNLVEELKRLLENYDENDDEFSAAEQKIIDIEHQHRMRILGEVVQTVYVHCFDRPMFLVGICKALLRYDLDEVNPWGSTMLAGLINHPDERVKEYVIQLIDNWKDTDLLPILKTIQVSEDWLQDYINDVVETMERKNVLYKETV